MEKYDRLKYVSCNSSRNKIEWCKITYVLQFKERP